VLDLPTGTWADGKLTGPSSEDLTAMMNQVGGWWPLANGASGFAPESYRSLLTVLRTFPDDRSVADLRARGIRTIVFRLANIRGTPWERAREKLSIMHFPVIALDREIAVYDLG